MNRYAVDEQDWSPAQRAFAEGLRASARGKIGVPFLNLQAVPSLAEKVAALGHWLRFEGALDADIRELLTLAVAEFHRCPYEWLGHAALGAKAGLDVVTLRALGAGETPATLTPRHRLALEAARTVMREGRLDDHRFGTLSRTLGREGALELVCLCGYYGLLAFVINTGYADGDQPDWQQTVDLTLRDAL